MKHLRRDKEGHQFDNHDQRKVFRLSNLLHQQARHATGITQKGLGNSHDQFGKVAVACCSWWKLCLDSNQFQLLCELWVLQCFFTMLNANVGFQCKKNVLVPCF